MLTHVEEYLRYRRALGYALRIEGGMLLNFARFADREGHRGPLTSDLATRWARLPTRADRLYWARRIEVLIGFARYCKIFDSQTEIPPRHLFGPAHRRKTPYIYSYRQLEELLSAARRLSWDGELRTYCTLFGLLACTGLRISEALGLRRDEVDLKQGTLTVKESKRRRFRLVPLHPSAVPPLEVYNAKRTQRFPEASFFFVNHFGNRLPYTTVRITFRKLTLRLGWSKTANALASTTYDIRLPAAFYLNGALARPDKRTASTGCPTTSVTSGSPTLIGIFQPLQNSLPMRRSDSNLRSQNPLLDEYARTVR